MHLCHKLLDQTQNQTCSRYSYYKSVFQISFHYVQALLIKMNIFFLVDRPTDRGTESSKVLCPHSSGTILYYFLFKIEYFAKMLQTLFCHYYCQLDNSFLSRLFVLSITLPAYWYVSLIVRQTFLTSFSMFIFAIDLYIYLIKKYWKCIQYHYWICMSLMESHHWIINFRRVC